MFLREKLFLQLIAYSEDKKQTFQIIKCINHNQYFEFTSHKFIEHKIIEHKNYNTYAKLHLQIY